MGDELTGYRRALDALFARTTGVSKFGLERTEAFLRILGNPHLMLRVIHVAGTNGKGSVCATLDAMLRAQGLKVGRYTSPHLVDFRERFLVNGAPIDADYVMRFLERWTPTVEELGVTFFEATTAMAFAWFARRDVDIAIVETGLGGRLDATNVVRPLVSTVTGIGFDHVEILGRTREAIAGEKAGIFKARSAAVIGESDAAIASVLAGHARARGATPIVDAWRAMPPHDVVPSARGTTFRLATETGKRQVHTPLAGAHQASNTTVALLTLREAGAAYWPGWDAAIRSLEAVRLPGRFHQVGRWIFDVAHNPDGARVLVRTLREVAPPSPITAVVCVLADKDWRGVLEALAEHVSHLVLTNAPTAPSSRAWNLDDVATFAGTLGVQVTRAPEFEEALAIGERSGGTALVTGSFHTVGDAMARLHVSPLAD
ncbi:MAG: bifunctional folylpolyglutamate synthase/dihydrofolate synthase [Gemmatimonadaceae bacterium]|nr:bifunctional folylpolyglutamate synthase/dihydrofolate synthase [Gemmatimonadaceae bacterium]